MPGDAVSHCEECVGDDIRSNVKSKNPEDMDVGDFLKLANGWRGDVSEIFKFKGNPMDAVEVERNAQGAIIDKVNEIKKSIENAANPTRTPDSIWVGDYYHDTVPKSQFKDDIWEKTLKRKSDSIPYFHSGYTLIPKK